VVSVLVVVVLVVGLESLVVFSLLGVLHLVLNRWWTSRNFELERSNGPRSSFRGFRSPLARHGWFPRGHFRGGSADGHDDMVCANPTLE
jgi:hypothetical protein